MNLLPRLATCLLATLAEVVSAAYNSTDTGYPPSYCKCIRRNCCARDQKNNHSPASGVGNNTISNTTTPPNKWGFVLFRSFEPLDLFGPYEALFTLSRTRTIDIYWLAETLDPVTTQPQIASMNPYNSSAFVSIPPTHTFATAPSDLEVLLVPGGAGARAPNLNATLHFIKERFPKLKYLITVCTGSMVVAKTGLLSGVRATTNKAAWNSVVALDPTAHWIPHARWAVDGNIWSSSGVSAGIDVTLAWISCHYGEEVATRVSKRV